MNLPSFLNDCMSGVILNPVAMKADVQDRDETEDKKLDDVERAGGLLLLFRAVVKKMMQNEPYKDTRRVIWSAARR